VDAIKTNKKHLLLSWALILLFVIAVEQLVGWRELLRQALSLPPHAALSALALLLLSYGWRALRLRLALRLPAREGLACLRIMVLNTASNNLLPARSGELSLPWLLRRRFGIPWRRALVLLLLLRLYDLYCLAGLLLLALWPNAVGLLLWLVSLLPPLLACRWRRPLLGYFASRRHSRLGRWLLSLLRWLPNSFQQGGTLWSCTLANWLCKLAMLAWLLMLMTGVNYADGLLGAIGGELSSVLPINPPANLGSYQTGVMLGLTRSGDSFSQLLGAAVTIHAFLLSASLLAAAIVMILPHLRRMTVASLR